MHLEKLKVAREFLYNPNIPLSALRNIRFLNWIIHPEASGWASYFQLKAAHDQVSQQ
jgi:hypothetical protein